MAKNPKFQRGGALPDIVAPMLACATVFALILLYAREYLLAAIAWCGAFMIAGLIARDEMRQNKDFRGLSDFRD